MCLVQLSHVRVGQAERAGALTQAVGGDRQAALECAHDLVGVAAVRALEASVLDEGHGRGGRAAHVIGLRGGDTQGHRELAARQRPYSGSVEQSALAARITNAEQPTKLQLRTRIVSLRRLAPL